mmetsp:Transcript_43851/g.121309  ORF Transcript_43851/g.121309 Transcript_43851/m.121309 type:complete len:231 (+) Transcript_43851:2409-3101(+)
MSSRRASRIRAAVSVVLTNRSWNRPAGSSVVRCAPARRSALAPYLDLAPIRKAAWLTESFALHASISASWFRSSRAVCIKLRMALYCATRLLGAAWARTSPSPMRAAVRCSEICSSMAATSSPSWNKAGRTPSASPAMRRTRTSSKSGCNDADANSTSKSRASNRGWQKMSCLSTAIAAGGASPKYRNALSPGPAKKLIVATAGSPTAWTKPAQPSMASHCGSATRTRLL